MKDGMGTNPFIIQELLDAHRNPVSLFYLYTLLVSNYPRSSCLFVKKGHEGNEKRYNCQSTGILQLKVPVYSYLEVGSSHIATQGLMTTLPHLLEIKGVES